MKAIGIDPGLAMTGFGVVETLSRGGKACDWGAIRTEANCPVPLRLKTIYDELKRLLEKWKPNLLVLEEVFVLKQFPKAAIQLRGSQRGDLSCCSGDGYSCCRSETDRGEECVDRKRSGRQRTDEEGDSANSQDRESRDLESCGRCPCLGLDWPFPK